MFTAKTLKSLCIATLVVALMGLVACQRGGTSGDDDAIADAQGSGDNFVADGGAGSTLTIRVDSTIGVGETKGFFVVAADPTGAPLSFIKITCDTELGLAILEPSAGGVATESTGINGDMSGQIGGLTPGSYLFECRASQGFNLVARTTVVVTGTVPASFRGFPGAAGGNLGGGRFVDQTPDADDDNGIRITGLSVTDGSSSATTAIDIDRIDNCDGDDATVDPETVFFSSFAVTVSNPTTARAFIDSVTIAVAQSSTVTGLVQLTACEVAAGSSATCAAAPFTDFNGTATSGNDTGKALAGTGVSFERGTFNTTFTISGTDEDGVTFTDSEGLALTFSAVDRCS